MIKKILLGIGVLFALLLVVGGAWATWEVHAYDTSMAKVYDVPLPSIVVSNDPASIERGKHLAESLGGCLSCHGNDLAHAKKEEMGPLGVMQPPNITSGRNGRLGAYSDAELARLLMHGIKNDGRSVTFMPCQDMGWFPPEDVAAVIAFVRSMPPVDTEPNVLQLGFLAKVLDRVDTLPVDVARRIDHTHRETAPPPAPTAEYGRFVGQLCRGCHGDHLAGGPIPGAPPEIPVPLNLTPDATGLKDWSYDDFVKLMRQGIRKNGKKLDPFMPLEPMRAMNDTELQALWAYLQTLPPTAFGER